MCSFICPDTGFQTISLHHFPDFNELGNLCDQSLKLIGLIGTLWLMVVNLAQKTMACWYIATASDGHVSQCDLGPPFQVLWPKISSQPKICSEKGSHNHNKLSYIHTMHTLEHSHYMYNIRFIVIIYHMWICTSLHIMYCWAWTLSNPEKPGSEVLQQLFCFVTEDIKYFFSHVVMLLAEWPRLCPFKLLR